MQGLSRVYPVRRSFCLRVYRGGCSFGTGFYRLLPTHRLGYRYGGFRTLASLCIPSYTGMMSMPYFFGYGSLVNRRTHVYDDAHPARIRGWRRTWRHIEALDTAFLTVEPSDDSLIDGLIAGVPNADWAALDERETFYQRIDTRDVEHPLSVEAEIQVYHAPVDLNVPSNALRPILLSYLDVVVQGFLTEFGEAGVARFFDTTDGWNAPVLDDRAAPGYPRHQSLQKAETALVDKHLGDVGAALIRR